MEKGNKKGSSNYEGENANTVKNELRLNVDEQQDAIKLLKEHCDLIKKKIVTKPKKKKCKAQPEKFYQIICVATIFTCLKCFMNKFIH